MANLRVLDELIIMNNNLINQYSHENNVQMLKKHNLIASILEDKTAFDKMDIEIALNIISDIIHDDQYVFDVYKDLMLTNNP